MVARQSDVRASPCELMCPDPAFTNKLQPCVVVVAFTVAVRFLFSRNEAGGSSDGGSSNWSVADSAAVIDNDPGKSNADIPKFALTERVSARFNVGFAKIEADRSLR